jgi:hypothetical protein
MMATAWYTMAARSWVKFARGMVLLIGENPSIHRGHGDDPDLSLI